MIGADTNVLVRAALEDSPKEAKIAKEFLNKSAKNNGLFLSSYAILEMAWVLKVKDRTRKEIYEAVCDLLDAPGVMIAQRSVIINVLENYIKGKADFGDYLILAEGKASGAGKLATFDKALIKDNSHCQNPSKF